MMHKFLLTALLLLPSIAFGVTAQLNWQNKATVQAGISIERQLNDGPFSSLVLILGMPTSYDDDTIIQSDVSDNNYCYRLQAFNSTDVSDYSNTACIVLAQLPPAPIPLAAPSNLMITSITSSSLTFNWIDNSDRELSQEIQLRQSRPPRTFTLTVDANARTFTAEGLRNRTDYTAQIRAVAGNTVSAWSNQISGKTLR